MLSNKFYNDNSGRLYQIITTALYAEKNEKYIVYQELHSLYKVYTMPVDLFKETFKKYIIDTGDNLDIEHKLYINNSLEENKPADIKKDLPANDLMAFLDARTIREKIEILSNIKGNINEHMINSIEISLDMPAGFGDIDNRIEAVKRTLQTHERYEGKRLR